MAQSKSAEKRLRTSKLANLRNRTRKTELKTIEKRFRAAADAGDKAVAVELGRKLSSRLDKAAQAGTIHRNKAANKKSQVDKLVGQLAQ